MRHRQARELVVLGDRLVHVVREDQVWLARLDACRQQPDPQRTRADLLDHRLILGGEQGPFLVILDRAHEGVGDEDAVMEVWRLAVGITTGFFMYLELTSRAITCRITCQDFRRLLAEPRPLVRPLPQLPMAKPTRILSSRPPSFLGQVVEPQEGNSRGEDIVRLQFIPPIAIDYVMCLADDVTTG
jgi:hypothetical protein